MSKGEEFIRAVNELAKEMKIYKFFMVVEDGDITSIGKRMPVDANRNPIGPPGPVEMIYRAWEMLVTASDNGVHKRFDVMEYPKTGEVKETTMFINKKSSTIH